MGTGSNAGVEGDTCMQASQSIIRDVEGSIFSAPTGDSSNSTPPNLIPVPDRIGPGQLLLMEIHDPFNSFSNRSGTDRDTL